MTPVKSKPPGQNRPVTREEIVAAAASAFRRYGYRGATLTHIADEVGIQKASLYHHIESKESLLLEILDSGLLPTLQKLRSLVAVEGLSSCERFERAVHQHAVDVVATMDSHAVFIQDFDAISDQRHRRKYLALRREYDALLQDIVEACLSEHGRDEDARLTVLAILGMVNYMPRWYRPDGRMSEDEIASTFTRLSKRMVGCD